MLKPKLKKRKIEKEEVIGYCPKCNKEIVGSTSEQVWYNLDIHIRAKHKKEVKNEKHKRI